MYFLSADIFCPEPTINLTFYLFIAKAQNEQGILLFVHWKLALRLSNKRLNFYESYIFQGMFCFTSAC